MVSDSGTKTMPIHSISKSGLVWASMGKAGNTNDSDEMWTVLEAMFMQAFLPHFRTCSLSKNKLESLFFGSS